MSTHKKQFFKRHDIKEESLQLGEVSKISGVSFADLKEVYERGRGAWKTNIASVRVKGSFKKDASAPRVLNYPPNNGDMLVFMLLLIS